MKTIPRRLVGSQLKATFATMPRVALEKFSEEAAEGEPVDTTPASELEEAVAEHRAEVEASLQGIEAALEAFSEQALDPQATQFLELALKGNAERAEYTGEITLSEIQDVDPKMVAVESRRIIGEIRAKMQA